MNLLFSQVRENLGKFQNLLRSKTETTRRTLLKSDARQREANEAERLDRLRNPRDYQGR